MDYQGGPSGPLPESEGGKRFGGLDGFTRTFAKVFDAGATQYGRDGYRHGTGQRNPITQLLRTRAVLGEEDAARGWRSIFLSGASLLVWPAINHGAPDTEGRHPTANQAIHGHGSPSTPRHKGWWCEGSRLGPSPRPRSWQKLTEFI